MTGLTFEVMGLPPTKADDARSSALICDVKDLMRKNNFMTIHSQGVRLAIEFQARAASGFSDPVGVIDAISIALETAGVYSSCSLIRDVRFIRKTAQETKYFIGVSMIDSKR